MRVWIRRDPDGFVRGAMQGKLVKGRTRVYACGRHREAGDAACTNSLQRPADDADRVVIGAVARYLDEETIGAVLKEVRRRLREQSHKTSTELPRLRDERLKLAKEIERMAEAVATAPNVKQLATKLAERQERLTELDARIQILRTAPGALDLEVRRLEKQVRTRLAGLRDAVRGNVPEARRVLSSRPSWNRCR
jgi:hypothetical protein